MEPLLAGFEIELDLSSGSIDTGRERAGLLVLAGMLLSFAFIRFSTRMIRAEVSWWPGNVTPGGLHIHHLVFGIVAMMVAGFLGFALQPASPWLEILAALFGVGVGLTLDEFALWLYLEDVYWSEEGRRSIDAVILATILAGAVPLGLVPVSTDDSLPVIVISILLVLAVCFVVAAKGKMWSAAVGVFVPLIGIAAAIRLAMPESPWARRRYPEGSEKLTEARRRKAKLDRRRRRFQDLVGGAPDRPSPRDG